MIAKKDYVVLLHGFLRTAKSMRKIEKALSNEGYEVINLDYPWRKETIKKIADNYLKKALQEKCPDKNRKIHFITHSMGGIIVRYFLANNKVKNLGRVVMLAPPNKGSKWADFFSAVPILGKILGPALKQLTTNKKSLPNTLPLPNYELCIIAGKYDKKVPIESAKLKNTKSFLVVPRMHTYIMNADEVVNAAVQFLKKENSEKSRTWAKPSPTTEIMR